MNTIKSITNSFYLFCLLLVSAGCNNTENFLNESPTGFADPNTLLKDKKVELPSRKHGNIQL